MEEEIGMINVKYSPVKKVLAVSVNMSICLLVFTQYNTKKLLLINSLVSYQNEMPQTCYSSLEKEFFFARLKVRTTEYTNLQYGFRLEAYLNPRNR